ncbi:MAG: preprotein translocase subunit SecA [Candidatus Karelsulcia muelleri]
MNFFSKILNFFWGKKKERDLKNLKEELNKIRVFEKKINSISNEELREKTFYFKKYIKEKTKFISDKISLLQKKLISIYKNNKVFSIEEIKKEKSILKELKILNYNLSKEEEKILLELLPEAFAVVKETAKRFKENKKIIVNSNKLDYLLSKSRSYLKLKKGKTIWKTKWSYSGKKCIWDMIHYDVQLIGGIVLHQGKIAEMYTGEGKTLVATLPIYLNALSGRGVHVVTVNEYLAKRDSEWMAPILEFHGITVDCIDLYSANSYFRRKAYEADVTYGTNNEFGFDYLRDNMVVSYKQLIQKELNYAIIDEVDSVLIDEARTPLIISSSSSSSPKINYSFSLLKKTIKKIINKQLYALNKFLNLARKKILFGNKEEGGVNLFKVSRGLPTYKPLIKFLVNKKIRNLLEETESFYMQENNKNMFRVDSDLYFIINEKNQTIEFSEKGMKFVSHEMKDTNFFRIPNIYNKINNLKKKKISNEKKIKNKIINNFYKKTNKIHTINQLIKAYTLFEKNRHYIIIKNKVKIVDEQTGRILEGRRYSDGLHQALEAKENVNIENSNHSLANITLQNFFKMYNKISGMTGTAETEYEEFIKIYNLDVIIIPTNKPIIRKNYEDILFKTKQEKYNAILKKVIFFSKIEKRSVLVGTSSVEESEFISKLLNSRNIPNNVLNAKYSKKETNIIEKAGLSGRVTIATHMAGRGTDIKISEQVKKAGGLAIIGTERHYSRRIDRQLIGRSGRQGDPGSAQFFLSLEDDLMRIFGFASILEKFGKKEYLTGKLISNYIKLYQKQVEQTNFNIRKRLVEYDSIINEQRKYIYSIRKNSLNFTLSNVLISQMIFKIIDHLLSVNSSYKEFEDEIFKIFNLKNIINEKSFFSLKKEILLEKIYSLIRKNYNLIKINFFSKIEYIISYFIFSGKKNFLNLKFNFSNSKSKKKIIIKHDLNKNNAKNFDKVINKLENKIIIYYIDEIWKNHIKDMDDLILYSQNSVYDQKDPIIFYKKKAYELFKKFLFKINKSTIKYLFNCQMNDSFVFKTLAKRKKQEKQEKQEISKILNEKN